MNYLNKIRIENPLTICYTNDVVKNFTANGLLSIGASPAMSEAPEEAEEFYKVAQALLINIGTLTAENEQDIIAIAQTANEAGLPIVFDPVAVGASTYRKQFCKLLLKSAKVSVIKGNASEILALIDDTATMKGQVEDKNSVIVFKNVSFQYQSDASFTLKDVSFNIPKGQWTSIVGHNGSGKSTIAKLMIGIEKVKSGEIFYNNQAITDDNFEKLRKDIGIVFQNPDNQFVGSIVKYDVAFGLENHAVPYDEMHRRVSEALKQVDMLERADYEPNALSGGQKQRVAIASVLALNPSVIILDEATSMLDPDARQNLLDLVRKVKSEHNITIISITHDLSEAMEADHVIVMNKGTVYKEGTATEIFDNAEELTRIGLDLPFPIKINQMLGHQTSFLTYEGLVDQL